MKLSYFAELVKLRLSLLATFAAASGYVAARHPQGFSFSFILMVTGSFLIGGGANAMNQWVESGHDSVMLRTRDRVIPRGAMSSRSVFFCAAIFSIAGFGLLCGVNPTAALLGVFMWVAYVFVYTPLKRVSPLNVIAGSVCGAVPPLIGWFGSGNHFSFPAFLIFFQLLVWQIPHFAAIAWKYREDYSRASFKMPFLQDSFKLREKLFVVISAAMYLLSTSMFFQENLCGGIMWYLSLIVAVLFMINTFFFINHPQKKTAQTAVTLSIISLSCSYIGLWIHALLL